ncbi:MAG TPA: sugar ABC transporter substrate-binding protein [Chloroflexia bacterium]|jgi:ABC-type glycerol-3-phosphate transport system substrate-binding protein|nr:sugar ABC transporter substrate-binding protein [Chloroflexia bacterium]
MFAPCRKAWSIALLYLLMSSLVLAACDTGTTPAATPTPVAGTQDYGVPKNPKIAALGPVDLHVLFAADYYQVKPVVDVVNAFMQMYPNVHVTLEGTDWNQIPARVKTEIAGGTMSIDLAHQHAFVMGAQGFAESIDDLWPAIDASKLSPGSIEDTVWRGVHYGVPLDVNALFTIYRKDLFQKAGLPAPPADWTYEQAREYARKLTQGDVYGTVLGNSAWAMSGHVWANGGSLLSADGKTAGLAAPATVQITQYFSDLINVDHASPPAPAPGQRFDPVTVFWSGKAAILWTGPFDLGRLRNEAPDSFKAICPNLSCIGTATLPHGMDGTTTGSVQGGGSLFIPKGARHKEVAFELMRWYLSPVYQLAMVRDQARYPVLQDLYNTPELRDDPLVLPFYEQLKTAHPYTLEANPDADQAWSGAVSAILAGAPADETLKAAQQKAQAGLDTQH